MGLEVLALAALAGGAAAINNGEKQREAQNTAMDRQKEAAAKAEVAAAEAAVETKKQAGVAEMAMNKVNAKKPNYAGMLTGNEAAAKGGVGGTLLTGPQGIDLNPLLLGKNTLLGS
jgi:hypothetical protein